MASLDLRDRIRPANPRQRNALLAWSISVTMHLLTLVGLALLLFPFASSGGENVTIDLSTVPEDRFDEIKLSSRPDSAADSDLMPDIVKSIDLDTRLAEILKGSESDLQNVKDSRGLDGRQAGSGSQASFFGTMAYGDRFVYVIDMSSSMSSGRRSNSTGRSQNRFERAVAECLRSVEQLTPEQCFYVMLFEYKTRRMFDDPATIPVMVPATEENKQRLRAWLKGLQPSGGTDPRDAIYMALTMEPSAIFLLSDGEFNGHKKKRPLTLVEGNPTVEEIVTRHNSAASRINTVAYEAPGTKSRLAKLAATTEGEFRYVAPNAGAVAANQPRDLLRRRAVAPKRPKSDKKKADIKLANAWLEKASASAERGDEKAANLRYRALIARFPNLPHAQIAKKRLAEGSSGDLFSRRDSSSR